MNKIKIIFTQTLMISSAIFLCLGIQGIYDYMINGIDTLMWPWYIPISTIVSSFFCALPSFLLMSLDKVSGKKLMLRIFFHFLAIAVVVSFANFIFKWFETIKGYIFLIIMYVLVYIFVWLGTWWMLKRDERQINARIKELQDKE